MESKTPQRKKIYTRSGDLGETALLLGPRVSKDQPRIEVCGQVDELSSVLGVARAEGLVSAHREIVQRIQNELIEFCAEVVCLTPVRLGKVIGHDQVRRMEQEIDEIESFSPPFTHFITPGADRGSAYLHLARTVCRRAERNLVSLIRNEPEISLLLLSYLNRLSDLLFVMARREELMKAKPGT